LLKPKGSSDQIRALKAALGGVDGGSGGGEDADCGSVIAASGVAKLLLASESLLGRLRLNLDYVQGLLHAILGAGFMENLDEVLELFLKIVGNMVAGKISLGLLADFSILDEFLLGAAGSAAANDQASAEIGFGAKGAQSARHRRVRAALNCPTGMSGDALITLLTQRGHIFDKNSGDDRDEK